MTEGGGIENAVETRGEAERPHQIGGTHMLLVGRKEHPRSLGAQRGEIFEQAVV